MSVLQSIGNLLRFNKRNWKAVVLCLSASTVFWFFNALNKTYTTTLNFPLEWNYNTDNYIPVQALPNSIRMNVTGAGWNLLRHSYGIKSTAIVIPLERPSEVKKIVGSTLPALLGPQLSDLQIKYVATDTLFVSIEPIQGKYVKLVVDSEQLNFRPGYGISSTASIVPDCVFVQGPASWVSSIQNKHVLAMNSKKIDENVESIWPIVWPHETLNSEPASVQVSFQVQKLVVVKDSVKLSLLQLPKGKKPVLPSGYIHFEFLMPESLLTSHYQHQQIKAVIDLSKPSTGRVTLAPHITGLPPFSKLTAVDSVQLQW